MLVAFPLQRLYERPSVLLYTYIVCLVEVRFITDKFCELIYCVLSKENGGFLLGIYVKYFRVLKIDVKE